MGKPTIKGKIVIEYLSDERWMNLPSLTLARKIYNENKSAFSCIEEVRSRIRYYRASIGNDNRKRLAIKEFVGSNFRLPESDESDWYPFVFPKRCTKVLSLSDVHIPYHSISALNAALQFGLDKKADTILLNGDIIDCYQESFWVKDPRKRHLAEELEMARDFLKELRELFPNAYIFYKMGNHEERHEKYLMTKAPELLDIPEFELKELLDFNSLRIETISLKKQVLKLGHLNIVHGHEFGRSMFNPVNPARGLFLRAKTSVLAGHYHQSSEHTESDMNGEITTTWSQGCLCDLHPEYLPLNRWNHGFAYIETDGDNYNLDNIRIINGKIV